MHRQAVAEIVRVRRWDMEMRSNPKARITYRKRNTRCQKPCGGRSNKAYVFKAMPVKVANKLSIHDPVSVIGTDHKRHTGVVVSKPRIGKTLTSIQIAYDHAVETFRSLPGAKTMARVVMPVGRVDF